MLFPIVRKTIGIIEGSNIFLRLKAILYLALSTCEGSWSYDKKLSRYLFSKISCLCVSPDSKWRISTANSSIISSHNRCDNAIIIPRIDT